MFRDRAVPEGVRAGARAPFGAELAWERLLKTVQVTRSENGIDAGTSAPTDEVWAITCSLATSS
jgi:hypothetical protein